MGRNVFLGLIVVLAVCVPKYADAHVDAPVAEGSPHLAVDLPEGSFVVSNDTDDRSTYEHLKRDGHIASVWLFRLVRALQGHSQSIEPGAYVLAEANTLRELSHALTVPVAKYVTIPENTTKREMADLLAHVTGWDDLTRHRFVTAYTAIQWDTFNDVIIPVMRSLQEWDETETLAFTGLASYFSDQEYDLFANVYVPGEYLIEKDASVSRVASRLVDAVEGSQADLPVYLQAQVNEAEDQRAAINDLVTGSVELLPDLVLLPPEDVQVTGDEPTLIFTTTYWNQGVGPLELVADPATAHIPGDTDRDVFQRIYRIDTAYRDRLVGNFEWHDEHLHYHFSDFVDYHLEPVDRDDPVFANIEPRVQEKTTYCVRDVDPVVAAGAATNIRPTYRICGRNLQGISVGWGDSYYFSYADQAISLEGLPSGLYRLTYNVNPRGRFEESDLTNNSTSAILEYNAQERTVEVIATE